MNYNITKHAQKRMAQRGVRRGDLEVLLAHADLESDVGGQCTMLAAVLISQFDDIVSQTLLIGPALRHLALCGSMLSKRATGSTFRNA